MPQTLLPIARALDVIGDRWTILVLRDCFKGIRRFDEIRRDLDIARPVLADRLQRLVDHGVLEKRLYQERPNRYEYRLTADRPGALAHPGGPHALGRPPPGRRVRPAHVARPQALRPRAAARATTAPAVARRSRPRTSVPAPDLEVPRAATSVTTTPPPASIPTAPLDELLAEARAGATPRHGNRVTFSPKVFIPLTMLCRDTCGYCTFAQPPARLDKPYLEPEDVLAIARRGAAGLPRGAVHAGRAAGAALRGGPDVAGRPGLRLDRSTTSPRWRRWCWPRPASCPTPTPVPSIATSWRGCGRSAPARG